MNMQIIQSDTPDFTVIKAKQNAAWASGDYSRIGTTLQLAGEQLAERANLAPGSRVVDVAAGNGNATLAFARRWCAVTSTDYVPSLLERGKARAQAEGQNVTFQVADAEDMPFADGAFDAATSTYGVMFTPNQEKAASELLRVVRRGGKIALANWTPSGFIGLLFKTLGRHVPPPAGVQSPARWGDITWLRETFGPAAEDVSVETRDFAFRYYSPEAFVDFFRTFYGPMHKAFIAVGEEGAQALERDILDLIATFNVARDGTMNVPSEYAEVIITKA
ncbi:MAG: class I SAM-dependent methyltransferase [Pseudomonadota bacterium]